MSGPPDNAAPGHAGPTPRAIELKQRALVSAGFPVGLASALAADTSVELRDAIGLVRAGFPPEVAAEMLRRGDRPVF